MYTWRLGLQEEEEAKGEKYKNKDTKEVTGEESIAWDDARCKANRPSLPLLATNGLEEGEGCLPDRKWQGVGLETVGHPGSA